MAEAQENSEQEHSTQVVIVVPMAQTRFKLLEKMFLVARPVRVYSYYLCSMQNTIYKLNYIENIS